MDDLASREKIFFNVIENCVVAVNTETKRLKALQPQAGETFDPYKTFATCQLKLGLFQLATDGTCQVLLPDFKTWKFTVEARQAIPFEGDWLNSAMVALPTAWHKKADDIFPSRKVLVMGIRWDKHNLHPWVHDLDEGTWSNKMIALSDQTAYASALKEFEDILEKRKTDKTLKMPDRP